MQFPLRILIVVPAAVYAGAYAYLAGYHGRWNLLQTPIHESGALTLLQSTFYASHFLGHIPVHVAIALLLAGCCVSDAGETHLPRRSRLGASVVLFTLAALAFSLLHFGKMDTVDYILQRKQGVGNLVRGGSWNLHLASTTVMFAFLPVYVFVMRAAAGRLAAPFLIDLRYVAAASGLVVVVTVAANGSLIDPLVTAWTDPRYLAHSVRELATFPLTYFPLPLYFLWRGSRATSRGETATRRIPAAVVALAILFAAAFIYQAWVPLNEGIGELAQKPGFAKGGKLSIAYLLSSHYFEHFLDTVFFTLLTLWLASSGRRRIAGI